MKIRKNLLQKIQDKDATVGIVGLGYVGSAMADVTSHHGFSTIGFDILQTKVDHINKKKSKNFFATTDLRYLNECDIVLICVQTPVDTNRKPDLSILYAAVSDIARQLRKGQLIIFESSVMVGTTREATHMLETISGLTAGKDFFVAFSPERFDPGNTHFPLQKIPKVVSGYDTQSKHLALVFYRFLIKHVVPVSSLETAEMVKLFENTFRLINISLVNELMEYTSLHDIDMWEVVDAAATKPFGFLAHYPGPGIGGHCIPVDPYYLYEDAKESDIQLTLIKQAGLINEVQPMKVARRATAILDELLTTSYREQHAINPYRQLNYIFDQSQDLSMQSKGGMSTMTVPSKKHYVILLVGIAYKPNSDDVRESAAIKIWEELEQLGHTVFYHDPFVPSFKQYSSSPLTTIATCDMAIIVTHHRTIDYHVLASFGKPILDTRHVLQKDHYAHVYSL